MIDDASNLSHHSYQYLDRETPGEGASGGVGRPHADSEASSESSRRCSHGSTALCPGKGGRPQAHGVELVDANHNWPADVAQAPSAPRSTRRPHGHRRFNQFPQTILNTFARLHVMLIVFSALCVRSVQGKWHKNIFDDESIDLQNECLSRAFYAILILEFEFFRA